MRSVFNGSKNLQLHGIGLSSFLQIFLRCFCLIQKKKIVTYPTLILLKKFSYICIFSAGFKPYNLSYFASSSSILFSAFIIVSPPCLHYIAFSLIQLHWVLLLPLSQTLKEIKIFDLQNLIKVQDLLGNFTIIWSKICFLLMKSINVEERVEERVDEIKENNQPGKAVLM